MIQNRIVQLDGLRFIAVFMILIAHWVQGGFKNLILQEMPFVHGVTLFFVLSGYLITRSLFINKDRIDDKLKILKIFYIRRSLRIFPIYYILLFVLFILDFEQTRELIWWLTTYTTNIYQSYTNLNIQHLNHLWSLAVEEQFYLFWPFVILFTNSKNYLKVIILTILFSLLIKAYLFYFVGNWMATAYFTLSCMFALGLGALLAYLKLYKKDFIAIISKPFWLYISLFIYLLLVVFRMNSALPWFKEIFDEFLFAIVSTLAILRASENGFSSIGGILLEHRLVTYLGKISYGLYLYHLFVPSFYIYIAKYFDLSITNKPTLFFIYLFITILISHLSWILIEMPINKFKEKFVFKKR